jgi:hypothetical protein
MSATASALCASIVHGGSVAELVAPTPRAS